MTDDQIEAFFEREREAVPLLPAPPGRLDELQTVARRRRNRNTTVVTMAAAVVVAVAGTGVALSVRGSGGTNSNVAAPATLTPISTTSASADPAVVVATAGQAVPVGFRVTSVSFVRTRGWALGDYSCGAAQCAALLQTDDYTGTTDASAMPQMHWRTVYKPSAAATAALGLLSGTASVRFGSDSDGWIVANGRVVSTTDGGASWQPVDALSGVHVTALEASGTKAFAVSADGKELWVEKDSTRTWRPTKRLDLPPAVSASVDTIQLETSVVVVTRTSGSATTARYSPIAKASWSDVSVPCPPSVVAPLVSVVDVLHSQVVCGDGTTQQVNNTGGVAARTGSLPSGALSAGVTAASIASDPLGTIAAYTGAGLIGSFDSGRSWSQVATGDFGYIGMSSVSVGVALSAQPSSRLWVTTDGGHHWSAQSFG